MTMNDSARICFRWLVLVLGLGVSCFGLAPALRAQTAPQITVQPMSQTAFEGDTVSFSVNATGSDLNYQWRHATTNLPGATASQLILNNVTFDHAGTYSVIVSNSVGTAASEKALLTVLPQSLWAWGANDDGKATTPAGLNDAVALAAGGVHSLALRANGTVTAWGLNGYFGYTDVPAGLAEVVSMAAGVYHSLALRSDGAVVGWGGTEAGQFAFQGDWNGVVAVAAGNYYCLGLRADGTVVVAGDPMFGLPAVSPELRNVTAIAAGATHCLTLCGDGTVRAWGSQTTVPEGLTDVVGVACGESHNLALRANGTVAAWGANTSGQADVPDGLDNVVAIACGSAHSLALEADGTVVAWGLDTSGQASVPVHVFPADAIGAGCAATHSLAARAFGPPFITTRLANQVWTQLPRPEAVYFRVEATGARPLYYQWQRNGVDLPDETHSVLKVANPAAHPGRYSVIVSNALGVAKIPPATLQVTFPQTPLQTALDNDLQWTNGGHAAWFMQTSNTLDRVDAAQSGAVGDNQESWLETTLSGPGFLVYWWKASSEPDYDFLEFWLDGVLQPGRISGSTPWQQQIVPIPGGAHVVRWRYVKDAEGRAGLDAGFLDLVTFSPSLPSAAVLPNSWFQMGFTNSPAAAITVIGSTDLTLPVGLWNVLGNATEIVPGQFLFTDTQTTNTVQRFYRTRLP